MSESKGMQRRLGLLDATMIVAGSMIGSGIFIVSADIGRTVGSAGWLLMAWVVAGLVTLTAALSYGELAGMMPEAGGQFVYIRRAFGKLTSFLYGWTVFMVIQTGVIAAVGVAFAKYTAVLIPEVGMGDQNILFHIGTFSVKAGQLVSVGVIMLLTVVNLYGVKNGSRLQVIFTSAKLLALLALIVLGIGVGMGNGTLAQNFSDAWSASQTVKNEAGEWVTSSLGGFALVLALGSAMIGSLFSSDAWNNVTFIAGEIKDPSKNIPRSLFLGTLIVTILYVLANVAYLSLLPVHGVPDAAAGVVEQGIQFASYDTDRVGTSAAMLIFGDPAIIMMAVLIMISTFGCNNGLILAGARLFYAMAKDGLFFKKAGALNRHGVPGNALIFQGIWASILCFSGTYGDLIEYATFASLVFYMVTIAGIFVLRKREPDVPRPYKAFGYPVIPALYILVTLFICVCLLIDRTESCVASLIIVAVGLPVYFLFNMRRKTG
ncbi:MAG: basic amino acid/polyamine antiporter, APA family [Bacteroidetes bacterium]|nr:MAG: basic amino acid/polyamine antiporter, APA family [Bacteroidota bacterium]